MSNRRIALGHRGEDWAAAWYEENGYSILARNWRCAQGEIDLLCTQLNPAGCVTLVICEVKARTSNTRGHPLEAVTPAKQQRLRRLATAYLASQGAYYDHLRFDVIGVTGQQLHVVEGAF
ncbi:MAG TPA: YraN family protein [Acidimicrobiales bacterium]|nr:YraN family protein [Acidimicrobiales bacterium]